MALEYLMGTRMEARYRLAARVALFIGTDDDDIKRIYKQTQTLYDARSAHAHGSVIDQNKWKEFYKGMFGTRPRVTPDEGIIREIDLVNSAVEAGLNLVRRTLLGCLRLQAKSPNGLGWPFPADFEEILFTSERMALQRRAGVKKGISF